MLERESYWGNADYGFYYGPTVYKTIDKLYNYEIEAIDAVDQAAKIHDQAYDAVGATADNASDSWATIAADLDFLSAIEKVQKLGEGGTDPFNGQMITHSEYTAANRAAIYFNFSHWNKIEAVSDWMEVNFPCISKKGTGFFNDDEFNQMDNYKTFQAIYMNFNNETGFWEMNKGMWKKVGLGIGAYWMPKTQKEMGWNN